ncbi:hypothetical protein BaRGS_00038172 [Batillaria attramentaria]|uniref:Uncharacterized protein n=1 Tax=Batillaria attramentaria TaxID=370345 RepID=A0ABD0J739_9CAEN
MSSVSVLNLGMCWVICDRIYRFGENKEMIRFFALISDGSLNAFFPPNSPVLKAEKRLLTPVNSSGPAYEPGNDFLCGRFPGES